MADFTPQEIEQFLQEFFDVVGTRQYIGARYVPLFGRRGEESIEWDNSAPYEPLTVVLYQGSSFTSRTYVPAGVDILDEYYWANTGNYNAQVEAYRREVIDLQTDYHEFKGDMETDWADYKQTTDASLNQWKQDTETDLSEWKQDTETDLSEWKTDTVEDFEQAIDNIPNILPSSAFDANNTVKDSIDSIDRKLNPRWMCHRGYTGDSVWARDNSSIAYVAAFDHGFNGYECDLRKDANGVIVCLHDADVSSVSNSSGNIDTLSYDSVTYASTLGEDGSVKLTTLVQSIQIAKNYHGFVLFDMGKEVVTMNEVIEECESADFYDYGFFNVTDNSEYAGIPDYVVKVWGNNIFQHTESELDSYLSYGTKNNAIRLLYNITDLEGQIELAKSKGFKIIFNYDGNIATNALPENFYKIDYMLGDNIPYGYSDTLSRMNGGILQPTKTIESVINSMPPFSVQCMQIQNSHPQGISGDSILAIFFKNGSNNWVEIIGISLGSNNHIYKRVVFNGTLSGWTNCFNNS